MLCLYIAFIRKEFRKSLLEDSVNVLKLCGRNYQRWPSDVQTPLSIRIQTPKRVPKIWMSLVQFHREQIGGALWFDKTPTRMEFSVKEVKLLHNKHIRAIIPVFFHKLGNIRYSYFLLLQNPD